MRSYVHSYSETEANRLRVQAGGIASLLHHDTIFPVGATVLEAGCGVGAQTAIIARQNPKTNFVSIDISTDSLKKAEKIIQENRLKNVTLQHADIFQLPFSEAQFDHIFVCYVLEHLPKPENALESLRRVLKSNGTITVIEGDHGSWYCYPRSKLAQKTVDCLVNIQAHLGGNALIGRELFPLLQRAQFRHIQVSPRMVYVDASKPQLVEEFSKGTFNAMVKGVKDLAMRMNLMDEADWDQGIRDLYRATEADGVFCYTFFKANGIKRVA